MGKKDIKLPTLIEALAAYGVAFDGLNAELEALKKKFPGGAIPIEIVKAVVSQYAGPGLVATIIDGITADVVTLLATGRGAVVRDDSALA